MAPHSPDDCKNIFVTWVWLVAILVGAISGATLLAWTGATQVSETKYELSIIRGNVSVHETRIIKLEKMSNDLDSIKAWVRK